MKRERERLRGGVRGWLLPVLLAFSFLNVNAAGEAGAVDATTADPQRVGDTVDGCYSDDDCFAGHYCQCEYTGCSCVLCTPEACPCTPGTKESCFGPVLCDPGNPNTCAGECPGRRICSEYGRWEPCFFIYGDCECIPGSTRDCSAPSNCPGEQVCQENYHWGDCEPFSQNCGCSGESQLYLGDVWSQWTARCPVGSACNEPDIGVPLLDPLVRQKINITQIGLRTKAFGPDDLNNIGNDPVAVVQGVLERTYPAYALLHGFPARSEAEFGVTVYGALQRAASVGVEVNLVIDSSCDLGDYHTSCSDAQQLDWGLATAPYSNPGHFDNALEIYKGVAAYLAASTEFAGVVTHLQFENEPCYRSFNAGLYADLVAAAAPLVRAAHPTLRLVAGSLNLDDSRGCGVGRDGDGGDCGGAVVDRGVEVDVLGTHAVVTQNCSNSLLAAALTDAVNEAVMNYPCYDIWVDELGIGSYQQWFDYTDIRLPDGAVRIDMAIRACFDAGAKGVLYLITGGEDPPEAYWNMTPLRFIMFSPSNVAVDAVTRIGAIADWYGISR